MKNIICVLAIIIVTGVLSFYFTNAKMCHFTPSKNTDNGRMRWSIPSRRRCDCTEGYRCHLCRVVNEDQLEDSWFIGDITEPRPTIKTQSAIAYYRSIKTIKGQDLDDLLDRRSSCSSWAEWSTAEQCFYNGTCPTLIERKRECLDTNDDNKISCFDHTQKSTQDCEVAECPTWSSWEAWSDCPCGSTKWKHRKRTCPIDNVCHGPSTSSALCTYQFPMHMGFSLMTVPGPIPCPAWNSWSRGFSECHNGKKYRRRLCYNYKDYRFEARHERSCAGSDRQEYDCDIFYPYGCIGLNAAVKLARDGFEVILACRNPERGQNAVQSVKQQVVGAKVTFMQLDLASLKSIRMFADSFHASRKPLHVLCNNAGLTTGFKGLERQTTDDGFETTFGVNHLGHFLLTMLLIEDLKKSAAEIGESRVVVTTSSLHDPANTAKMNSPAPHTDFDNLMLEKERTFHGQLAYSNSKLANVLFTYELARRLKGTGVTANCLCPGFIPETGLMQNESAFTRFLLRYSPVSLILKLKGVTSTVDEGGMILYHLASDSSLKGVTGKYFQFLAESESSKESHDEGIAKKLWDVSAELVGYEDAKDLGI